MKAERIRAEELEKMNFDGATFIRMNAFQKGKVFANLTLAVFADTDDFIIDVQNRYSDIFRDWKIVDFSDMTKERAISRFAIGRAEEMHVIDQKAGTTKVYARKRNANRIK